MNQPINLKRLRTDVLEHRYSKYEIDVTTMLKLIDELIEARAKVTALTSANPVVPKEGHPERL